MTTIAATFEILGSDFDLDQLNDIATHGMAQGVAGFIYSSDLYDIYEANEESIMGYLDDQADNLGEQNGFRMVLGAMDRNGIEYDSLQVFKEWAVWMFVEMTAHDLLIGCSHPDWV